MENSGESSSLKSISEMAADIHCGNEDDWKPQPHRFIKYFQDNPLNVEKQVDYLIRTEFDNRLVMLNTEEGEKPQRPCLIMLHRYKRYGAELSRWLEALDIMAQKYKSKHQHIYFYLEDLGENRKGPQCYDDYEGVPSPWMYAIDLDNQRHLVHCFSDIEELTKLCEKLLARKLYRSDPVPTKTKRCSLIKKVVADNFDPIVMQSQKDILFTVYSPWCYNWKHLKPELDDVAASLNVAGDSVEVVILNANSNYVMPQFVTEFSTDTWLLPANRSISSDPYGCDVISSIRYTSYLRSYRSFIEFISANSTKELRNYDRQGVERPNTNEETTDVFALQSMFGEI